MSVRSLTIASFGAATCLALVYLGLGLGVVGHGAPGADALTEDAASWYRTALVAVSLLSVALSALAAFVFSRRVVMPIEAFTEAVGAMAESGAPLYDDGARPGLVYDRKDELGLLAAAINRLYSRLREEAALSRGIIDEAPFPAIRLDNDGTIAWFNRPASLATGFSEAEAKAMARGELMAESSSAAFHEALRRAAAGERLRDVDLDFACKDGAARAMMFNALPVPSGQKAAGSVFMGRDRHVERGLMDELYLARAQARESSEKLKRTVKDLEEFALLAVRRELKMREIRERLIALRERASGDERAAEDLVAGQGAEAQWHGRER